MVNEVIAGEKYLYKNRLGKMEICKVIIWIAGTGRWKIIVGKGKIIYTKQKYLYPLSSVMAELF